jgi:hypothetical protein
VQVVLEQQIKVLQAALEQQMLRLVQEVVEQRQ